MQRLAQHFFQEGLHALVVSAFPIDLAAGCAAVEGVVVTGCAFGELVGNLVTGYCGDNAVTFHTAAKRNDLLFEVKTIGDFG